MISLKKYLDSAATGNEADGAGKSSGGPGEAAALAAYGAVLAEMGSAGAEACPALGAGLKDALNDWAGKARPGVSAEALRACEKGVQEQLRSWGRETARHYQQKTSEVKEMLLAMARTAESVGERDHRAAAQLGAVTTRLHEAASLDDLTEMRRTIEHTAEELKDSIVRMEAEGRAVIEGLKGQLSVYQARLEEAEYIAACDALTGVGSRLWVEGRLQQRADAGRVFSAVMVDIDAFKDVNDTYGHLVGDAVLKKFAAELRSACSAADAVGRWGGDEFLVMIDCGLEEARSRADQLHRWVSGSYEVAGASGPVKLEIAASIGAAEYRAGEALEELLDRADSQMYAAKAEAHRQRLKTSH